MIAGQSYSIGIKRNEYEQEIAAERKQARSLSGKTVTTLLRRDRTWQISISAEGADTDKLFCMLDSMLAGASCTFDRDATINAAGVVTTSRPVTCELVDDSFKPKRLGMRSDAFQFTFKLREIGQPAYGENYYFDLDFTKGVNPDPTYFTYTRSGTMYAMRDDGKYYAYNANEMPSHYDMINGREMGAWFGGAITNSLLYSSDFSNAAWSASNCTKAAANSIFASGGVAQKVTGDGVGSPPRLQQALSTFGANRDCVFAIVEQGTGTTATLSLFDVTAASYVVTATLTYSTGAVALSGSDTLATVRAIKLLNTGPNGGATYILVLTSSTGVLVNGNSRRVHVNPTDNGITTTYGYVHHAQLHANTTIMLEACPPILTTSAAVTRNADTFVCTTLPNWITGNELTFAAVFDMPDWLNNGITRYAFSINDGTGNNRDIVYLNTTNTITVDSTIAGTDTNSANIAGATGRSKIAARFKVNDCALVRNGGTINADTAVAIPTVAANGLNRVEIGNSGTGSPLRGYTSRAMIKPVALTNAELQAWTV